MSGSVGRRMFVCALVALALCVAGAARWGPRPALGPARAVADAGRCRAAVHSPVPTGRVLAGSAVAAPWNVAFATFLGGSADEELREVIEEADGSILVGGLTVSADFPVTAGAFQTTYRGEPPGTCHPGVCGGDLVIARLSPDGSSIHAATYLGGSKQDRNVYGMELDRAGDIVVTSSTRSPDMPTTSGAYQPAFAGGDTDIQVSKLASDLTALRWCTYVGGSAGESPRGGLALDAADNVYVVGPTGSSDFPTTAGAYQGQPMGSQDAVVFALAPDGSQLRASTRLGGSGTEGAMGVVIDPSGRVHIVGNTASPNFPATAGAAQGTHGGASDAFLAGMTPELDRLLYATYLGGELDEWSEHGLHWTADETILLSGVSQSQRFPTTAGAIQRGLLGTNDGFVSRLSARDGSLVWSTILGGAGTEFYLWPTPDAQGNVYFVGSTTSVDFPVTADALQTTYGGGDTDGVLVKVDPTGSRVLYASFLGGAGSDLIRAITITPDGAILLVGTTSSPDFPATAGSAQARRAGPSDGFVVKLAPASRSGGSALLPVAFRE